MKYPAYDLFITWCKGVYLTRCTIVNQNKIKALMTAYVEHFCTIFFRSLVILSPLEFLHYLPWHITFRINKKIDGDLILVWLFFSFSMTYFCTFFTLSFPMAVTINSTYIYFLHLLRLTPDDFSRKGETSRTGNVKGFFQVGKGSHMWEGYPTSKPTFTQHLHGVTLSRVMLILSFPALRANFSLTTSA